MIQTFKLVGIIDKQAEGMNEVLPYIQVFEFDIKEEESIKMSRDFDLV